MLKVFLDQRMTVAAFVRWPGDGTDRRHELVDGRPVVKELASGRHAEIAANVLRALDVRVERPFHVLFDGGVAPDLEADECRLPDVFMTREPIPEHIFTDVYVVVEVLSPSTEKDDRTVKLDFYKSLPSVEAILLVWQDRRRVELHTREEARWPAQDFVSGSTVPLAGLGIELPLDEVYAGVEFPPPPPRKRRPVARD